MSHVTVVSCNIVHCGSAAGASLLVWIRLLVDTGSTPIFVSAGHPIGVWGLGTVIAQNREGHYASLRGSSEVRRFIGRSQNAVKPGLSLYQTRRALYTRIHSTHSAYLTLYFYIYVPYNITLSVFRASGLMPEI